MAQGAALGFRGLGQDPNYVGGDIPCKLITASRSTTPNDDQNILGNNTANNYTITVEANSVPNGLILEQMSTGTVTVAAGTGITFIGSTLATASAGQVVSVLSTPVTGTFIIKVA